MYGRLHSLKREEHLGIATPASFLKRLERLERVEQLELAQKD